MRISAVSVKTNNMQKSIEFYKILGLKFDDDDSTTGHVENIHGETEVKLMIDTEDVIKEILGCDPMTSNCSTFAILYDSVSEVDKVSSNLKISGFIVVKEPWDAFWGQRYCIVKDPGGHLIDLYAYLKVSA